MPEFIPVHTPQVDDEFTRGYLEAIEWLIDEEEVDKCESMSPKLIEESKSDCADFQNMMQEQLVTYTEVTGRSMVAAGVDFWLTRNGHGAGFWDRGSHPVLQELTRASKTFGSCDSYVGDDGLLYLA